jgi:glyceraldehyde 3-phosphate dehydrogenase
VAINDLGGAEIAAHLLKYDSTHGIFPPTVEAGENQIVVDNRSIPVMKERDPGNIKWGDHGVDIVLECTGVFVKNKEALLKHIENGAKKVLVSAPAEASEMTMVYGINHTEYDPAKHRILSNASCTTNCLAPLAKVLHENFAIERGLMTTIHSYTLDQHVLDSAHKDFRRARAAAMSMIPTTTGAAKAVGLVLPELKGKVDGFAVRVPTPNVSLVDFTINTGKKVSAEAINEAIVKAADGPMKGILAYEKKPLVSQDFNGNTHSSIVDLESTMVTGDNMAKVISWYDNETGFSHRMVDMAIYMGEKGL